VKRRNLSLIAGIVIATALVAIGWRGYQVAVRREAKYSLECVEKGLEWDKAHNVDESDQSPFPSSRAQSEIRACTDAEVQRSFARDSDIFYKLAGIVFAVFAIPWLWAFLLRRLTEVGKALSGKPPDEQ
jgi:hypothetical protein